MNTEIKTINLEEILEKHILGDINPHGVIYKRILNALRETCIQMNDLCAEEQKKYYVEIGYTNTGEKINNKIFLLKEQIV